RVGLLASLSRDASVVKLYDIQHYSVGVEEQEPAVITRTIDTDSNNNISAFSWHPTHENRIITASYSGKLIDYTVHERITLNWSVTSALVWTHGKKTLQHIDSQHPVYHYLDDIGTTIMKRALNKYGLNAENLAANGEVTNDVKLNNLWTWLDAARNFVNSGTFRLPG
ncbi:unnamed protein product, partial [Meganyctiphanes norvegica]